MITHMENTTRIQTGIRLDASLYEKLKRNAKKERRSLNNYITRILENAVETDIPKLDPSSFEIDDDLKQLGGLIGSVSDEQIQQDPRLKSILAL